MHCNNARHSHPSPRWAHARSSRWHGRGRGGARAKRGDIRAAVLALLAEKPAHGYEMIKELDERTEGAWRPSPGSIYPTLQLLEDEGLIKGTKTRASAASSSPTKAARSRASGRVRAHGKRSPPVPRRRSSSCGERRNSFGRPWAKRSTPARTSSAGAFAIFSTRPSARSTRFSPKRVSSKPARSKAAARRFASSRAPPGCGRSRSHRGPCLGPCRSSHTRRTSCRSTESLSHLPGIEWRGRSW